MKKEDKEEKKQLGKRQNRSFEEESKDVFELREEEKDLLRKEAKGKIDNEVITAVKQSEVCLFCNLQDLFTKYEFDDSHIIEPKYVRKSLEQIFFD